jgi:hypothetical protein
LGKIRGKRVLYLSNSGQGLNLQEFRLSQVFKEEEKWNDGGVWD